VRQMHYNYFRDYDPGIGRYVQSDPILQPGRLLGKSFVDGVVALIAEPRLLNGYSYSLNSSLGYADPEGLSPGSILFDIIQPLRCNYYTKKLMERVPECRKECSPDVPTEKWLEFHRKYGQREGFRGDAIWDCACERAGSDVCKKWSETCLSNPLPNPRPKSGSRQ